MPPPYGDALPDFKYINQIPIVELARKIGMEFGDSGNMVCWHAERHKDREPAFLTVLTKLNRIRCHACGSASMSVIDMLVDIGNFDSQLTAAQCFASELNAPKIPKGSHLKNPDALAVPPALKEPLALLIRSGVWANLSVPVQRLIPVLLEFTEWEEECLEGTLRLSYRAMMRYSGIGTFTSINPALAELEGIGWATRLDATRRGESPIKNTAVYRITPLSDAVKKLATSVSGEFGEAIKAEKAESKRKREARSRMLAITASKPLT